VSALALDDPVTRARAEITITRSSLADLLRAPGTETVLVGSSKDPNAKITVLLIPPGYPRPALSIKIPTTPSASQAVEAERRMLLLLSSLDQGVRRTIPRVVGRLQLPDQAGLVMSALPGRSMSSLYHRRGHTARPALVAADFAMAATWLRAFQEQTAGQAEPCGIESRVMRSFERRFHGEPEFSPVQERLQRVDARLRRDRTPRTAVHGDFWFGNLLVERGAICGVVDWEMATISGEPLRDVARFALAYALYLDRHTEAGRPVEGHRGLTAGRWGDGIAYAVDGRGWFPDLFRGFLVQALLRLGASARCWRALALAGIAEVAALADHPQFALEHYRLFNRLSGRADREMAA
jgi:aminoglycoside phosphotransferase